MEQILVYGKIEAIENSDISDRTEILFKTDIGNQPLLCDQTFANEIQIGKYYMLVGKYANSNGIVLANVYKQEGRDKFTLLKNFVLMGVCNEEFSMYQDSEKTIINVNNCIFFGIHKSMHQLIEEKIMESMNSGFEKGNGYLKAELDDVEILDEIQEQDIKMKM